MSWKIFAARAQRERRCYWEIYFRADREGAGDADRQELQNELAWASKRRTVQAQQSPQDEDASDFDRALNPMQTYRKKIYASWLNGKGVLNLGQDPHERPCYTRGEPLLNTITKQGDFWYGLEQKRWLTVNELAMVHNLPMAERDRSLAFFGMETSFMKCREANGMPPRRRGEVRAQIGNGMSVCCMGVGWHFIAMSLSILAALDSEPAHNLETELVRELKRQRSQ